MSRMSSVRFPVMVFNFRVYLALRVCAHVRGFESHVTLAGFDICVPAVI